MDQILVNPVVLSKLSNVVKNVVKKAVYDELIEKVNAIQAIDARDLV